MHTVFRSSIASVTAFFLFYTTIAAQALKPGFDADEYIGVLQRCAKQMDSLFKSNLPKNVDFDKIYSSPQMGMANRWQLWLSKDKATIAIDLRGTVSDKESWLENFYSAMIPATGSVKLDGKTSFNYKFADNSRASVHAGWTIGICSMLPDIMEKINSWYAKGVKQIIVEGHSQGAAMAFLLCSYIHYQQVDGKLPKDIVVKTYCSAAPKPGNLYYAYDFDYINRGGWANTVINAADWVPEMPFSVQTVRDVNLNPFAYTNKTMSRNVIVRWYTKHMFNSLRRATSKPERKNDKFLGRIMYKQVRKYVAGLEQPEYSHSCNYAQAGTPIILVPDAEYYKKFPDTDPNIFRNHLFDPYYYLVKKTYK
jgi:hypothetical protein